MMREIIYIDDDPVLRKLMQSAHKKSELEAELKLLDPTKKSPAEIVTEIKNLIGTVDHTLIIIDHKLSPTQGHQVVKALESENLSRISVVSFSGESLETRQEIYPDEVKIFWEKPMTRSEITEVLCQAIED